MYKSGGEWNGRVEWNVRIKSNEVKCKNRVKWSGRVEWNVRVGSRYTKLFHYLYLLNFVIIKELLQQQALLWFECFIVNKIVALVWLENRNAVYTWFGLILKNEQIKIFSHNGSTDTSIKFILWPMTQFGQNESGRQVGLNKLGFFFNIPKQYHDSLQTRLNPSILFFGRFVNDLTHQKS